MAGQCACGRQQPPDLGDQDQDAGKRQQGTAAGAVDDGPGASRDEGTDDAGIGREAQNQASGFMQPVLHEWHPDDAQRGNEEIQSDVEKDELQKGWEEQHLFPGRPDLCSRWPDGLNLFADGLNIRYPTQKHQTEQSANVAEQEESSEGVDGGEDTDAGTGQQHGSGQGQVGAHHIAGNEGAPEGFGNDLGDPGHESADGDSPGGRKTGHHEEGQGDPEIRRNAVRQNGDNGNAEDEDAAGGPTPDDEVFIPDLFHKSCGWNLERRE